MRGRPPDTGCGEGRHVGDGLVNLRGVVLQVKWMSTCKSPSDQDIRNSVSGHLTLEFISDGLDSFLKPEIM